MDDLIDESLQKLSIANQKCDNAEYNDAVAAEADGHMILMCWLCDSKSGYVYLRKGQQCNEYIYTWGIKNYLLSLYRARV